MLSQARSPQVLERLRLTPFEGHALVVESGGVIEAYCGGSLASSFGPRRCSQHKRARRRITDWPGGVGPRGAFTGSSSTWLSISDLMLGQVHNLGLPLPPCGSSVFWCRRLCGACQGVKEFQGKLSTNFILSSGESLEERP